jgi:putative phage-type endonuclease
MQVVNLKQGTPEWDAHRRLHLNASDAPSALGESQHKTRDQLLHEKSTGIGKEFSKFVQERILDKGHTFEFLGRQLAEKIIGEDLSPIVARKDKYSASFDGITFGGDIIFEHKTLNDDLRAAFHNKDADMVELPIMYRIQMEQQLYISGAEKCLFMASQWNGETLVEERHCWYAPDPELLQRVLAGWEQFEKDLESYVPPTVVEKVEAETVQALPVPSVVVKGEITASNLGEITPKFDAYLGSIKTELATDQDFADAEANAKNCRETAKRIEALQENIIAQMVSVNEVNGILGNYKEAFNKVGLRLEKAVKEQKETLKTNAILSAQQAYSAHVQLIEAETKPIRLNVPAPDFAGAIKGIKTVASMHSRINDALAAGKMAADAAGRDIRAKQAWLKENADGFQFLFNDIHTIIQKPLEDLQTLAKMRIAEHKEAEAEKAKALHAKAEADARAKIEAEQREAEAAKVQPDQRANAEVAKPDSASADAVESASQKVSSSPISKPKAADNTRMTIVRLVANHYGISEQNAEETIVGCFGLKKAA